jgi:molecular chaperone HtpG
MIDQHFIQHMESKNADYKFSRVDADTFDKMIEKDETLISVLSSEEEEALKKVFQENVPTEGVHVELKALSPDDMPVMITKNEFMRRMADMSKLGGGGMYSFMGNMPESFNLVVNTNHPIASKLLQATDKVEMIKNLYDLALLQQGMLKGSHLTAFINRSVESI